MELLLVVDLSKMPGDGFPNGLAVLLVDEVPETFESFDVVSC